MAKTNGGIIGPANIPTGAFGSAPGVWKLSEAEQYIKEGRWPVPTTGFQVANSLRFNSGSSDYLVFTDGTPTDALKWTYSTWVKRSTLGASGALLGGYTDGNNWTDFYFSGTNRLELYSASTTIHVNTNALFRDVSAWYHIVLIYDSANATASNRVKIYVNGVLQTINTATYPSLNYASKINANGVNQNISFSAQAGFDGYLAETVFVDGQALDPTSFGETDTTTGNWIPKDVSGLTFGTNGFYLPFQNAAALGQDDSGNGNNFTVNNLTSIDQCIDSPTNNFATMNPLIYDNYSDITYGNGNTTFTATGGNFQSAYSTLAVSSGKYYFELKHNSATNFGFIGIREASTVTENGGYLGQAGQTLAWGYYSDSGVIFNNGSTTAYGDSWNGTGDIVSCALDLDNNKLYFAKNGTWQNSGDPTSGATGTGAVSISAGTYYLAGTKPNSASATLFMNFGNAPFTISSGNTDFSGLGNFEYEVPSGYRALCTKNIGLVG